MKKKYKQHSQIRHLMLELEIKTKNKIIENLLTECVN